MAAVGGTNRHKIKTNPCTELLLLRDKAVLIRTNFKALNSHMFYTVTFQTGKEVLDWLIKSKMVLMRLR